MEALQLSRKTTLTADQLRELYRALKLPRMIEERMLALLRQGRLSKWFSGIGQEAIAVGATFALRENDVILPMHRNLGVFTTRGVPLNRLFRQLMGKSGGFTKGRDRSFHFGVPEYHIIGMISHLGAMLPVADGLGVAFQLKGEDRVALAFTGDGATSEGDFHEALNLAAVWKLPVIFLIENNGYGLSTPVSEQYACERLADRAIGYGMEGLQIDGNDVLAVYETVRYAAEKARRGEGPTLIEAMTFRMRGHEEASGTKYVPKALFEEWGKKDPILRLERFLTSEGLLNEELRQQVEAELSRRIEQAIQEALEAPLPESTVAQELADVYAPSAVRTTAPVGSRREIRYVDAISEGLRQKMAADERVLLMGQDIAEYGGVFKVTAGFVEQFGKARVRNTPIIESGAIGAALGLALEGFKPVVEMQFADFISCGFNQTVNNLAKTHYRWGAPVNVTIRMPYGGGVGAGPFHSQCPEAWFFHVPGLKLVAPATPYDAKGLLLAAIEDPNPVLYFEHKALYRSIRGEVPEEAYTIEIGTAEVKRPGKDATIVTYGLAVHWALEAAELLAKEGAEIEVVDLRSLLPWDKATVLASVEKTNRVLVLHEANLTGGIGAEIAAAIAEEGFTHLDAPVMRLASLDTPIPFSPQLEQHIYWPRDRLPDKLRALLAF
ncbi:MAG: dehydrogenase [Calditrichaeota bacterium]|nr:MAG: dehydrogenase [Calditrichota bacterium]